MSTMSNSQPTGAPEAPTRCGSPLLEPRYPPRKTVGIYERWKVSFSADFFNLFNHENFANPSLSFASPATFGVITGTFTPPNRTNSARWIELGLRLDF